MTITHHLDDATLMSFAAGSLPAALSAVAAAHVAMCTRCRREVAGLERVGGALLAELLPATLDRAEPPASAIWGQTPRPDVHENPHRAGEASSPIPAIPGALRGAAPAPLARLLPRELDNVRWRRLGLGVWHHRLAVAGRGGLGLLKVAPGRVVPEHGHAGAELTLVLRGSFHDATGRYLPGDVADLDETIEHKPIADPGRECICLVASERPSRFRGLLARLLQPLHGL
jgi:putative transcriptional regulator